jgi:hypothetical protein
VNVSGVLSVATLSLSTLTLSTLNATDVNTTNINGVAFYPAFGEKVLRVAVNGCDAIASIGANRYAYPFLTISQAIASSSAGDAIDVLAGTYTESNIVLLSDRSIRGANAQSTIIQGTLSDTGSIFTLQSNCRLEDLTITLSSTLTDGVSGAVYSAIQLDNGNIPSSKIRTMVINVFNTNSHGNAVGVLAAGDAPNPFVFTSASTIRATTINATASGLNPGYYTNCIRVAGSNRTSARDTVLYLTATNCSGADVIAAETVSAGVIDLRSSTVSASGTGLTNCSLAEISQTASGSEIVLGYTDLDNNNANGIGFTVNQTPANIIFGTFKNGTWNNTDFTNLTFLPIGTSPINLLPNTIEAAVPFTIQQDGLIHDIVFRTNVSMGASSISAALLKNSNTLVTFTISGNTDNMSSNFYQSFKVVRGDTLSVSIKGTGTAPTGLASCIFDFGLY